MTSIKSLDQPNPGNSVSVFLPWLLWIISSTAGGTIGWFVSIGIGMGTLGLGLLLAGGIVGGSVGMAQGFSIAFYLDKLHLFNPKLRSFISRFWFGRISDDGESRSYLFLFGILWIVTCIIGMHLCLMLVWMQWPGLVNIFSGTSQIFVAFAGGGMIYGLVQVWFLPPDIRTIISWLVANAIGWAAGAYAGLRTAEALSLDSGYSGIIMGPRDYAFTFVSGSIGTFVYSLITGLPLVWLFYQLRLSSTKA